MRFLLNRNELKAKEMPQQNLTKTPKVNKAVADQQLNHIKNEAIN